jgi:hypothetical protein
VTPSARPGLPQPWSSLAAVAVRGGGIGEAQCGRREVVVGASPPHRAVD